MLEQPINIQSGKCYSVVGVGMGVTQVDIQLVMQPGPMMPPVVMAQSPTRGVNAVLGGKLSGCFKNPMPVGGPGKVVLHAQGAGLVGAQVYIK